MLHLVEKRWDLLMIVYGLIDVRLIDLMNNLFKFILFICSIEWILLSSRVYRMY